MASTAVVLGLDFGGTKVAAATCDLDGHQLHREIISTRSDEGGEAVLARGLDAAGELLSRLGNPPLDGIGVATIGVPNGRFVELAPAIPGWEHIPLAERVADALGAPSFEVALGHLELVSAWQSYNPALLAAIASVRGSAADATQPARGGAAVR